MPHQSPLPIEPNALTAQAVAEYLKQQPDFFVQYPQLLETLMVSDDQQGTVSFVEAQMKRLRTRISELEEDITQFMALAAKNDRTFIDLMALQKELLQCQTISDIKSALNSYATSLGLTAYLGILNQVDKKWQLEDIQYQRVMKNHLAKRDVYLGRLTASDQALIFGSDFANASHVHELGSCVILPLKYSQSIGLLAFYSTNGRYFVPQMDTLFLEHLASVTAYVIEQIQTTAKQAVGSNPLEDHDD